MREINESTYLYDTLPDEAVKDRVRSALNSNIRKGEICRRCYYGFTCLTIIAPLVIVVGHSLDDELFLHFNMQTYNVILVAITTIATAVNSMYHFKDQWHSHQKAVEAIKNELIKYHMEIGAYKEGGLKLLSETIEVLIVESHNEKMRIINKPPDEKYSELNK